MPTPLRKHAAMLAGATDFYRQIPAQFRPESTDCFYQLQAHSPATYPGCPTGSIPQPGHFVEPSAHAVRLQRPTPRLEALLHRMTDPHSSVSGAVRNSLSSTSHRSARLSGYRPGQSLSICPRQQRRESSPRPSSVPGVCPLLLGHRFPAEDIPPEARELFLTVRQRNIVNVVKQAIGVSPLIDSKTQQPADQALKVSPGRPLPCGIPPQHGVLCHPWWCPCCTTITLWGLLVAPPQPAPALWFQRIRNCAARRRPGFRGPVPAPCC